MNIINQLLFFIVVEYGLSIYGDKREYMNSDKEYHYYKYRIDVLDEKRLLMQ